MTARRRHRGAGSGLPWLARALARFLPARQRDAALGDLEEEYREVLRHAGKGAGRHLRATAWCLRETGDLLSAFLAARVAAMTARLPGGRPGRERRPPGLTGPVDDLRQARRHLAADPGLAVPVVLTLALAIGANGAIFGVVDAVLLEPLPYPEPERLVTLWESSEAAGMPLAEPSPLNFMDWRRRVEGFEGMAGWYTLSGAWQADGRAEQLDVARVAGDFFEVLGTPPALGRTFTAREARGARYESGLTTLQAGNAVAVASHGFWRRALGGDAGALGRHVVHNGTRWRIVGVMPEGFRYPRPEVALWTPWDPLAAGRPEARDARWLQVVGRLAPDAGVEETGRRLAAVAADLAREHPSTNDGWSARIVPLSTHVVGDLHRPLWLLYGTVTLVLLAACANVAGLGLARATTRRRELGMRLALGAGPGRLLRQLLAESLIVGTAGGLVGLALAAAILALLSRLPAGRVPRLDEVGLDPGVVGFTLLVAVGAGLVSGAAPALLAARTDVRRLLGAGGRSSLGRAGHRLRALVVVAQVAVAFVLLAAALLLATSLARLHASDPGFETDGRVVVRLWIDSEAGATVAGRVRFFSRVVEELQAWPEVVAAGGNTALPMSEVGSDFDRPFWRRDREDPGAAAPETAIRMVTPGYFRAMGIPLLAGRTFDDGDRLDFAAPPGRRGDRVILVNRALAETTWPGEAAVGRILVMDYPGGVYEYRVVGVVGDTRRRDLRDGARPEAFIPYAQNPYPVLSIVAHAPGHAAALAPRIRDLVASIDADQPVHSIVPLESLVAATFARERVAGLLVGGFATLTLLVALVGVHGVVALVVGRRTGEIGLRMALGASRGAVARRVLGSATALGLAGLLTGLAGALAGRRLVAGLLFATDAADPLILGSAAVALLAGVLVAAARPARRAMAVEPARSLSRS